MEKDPGQGLKKPSLRTFGLSFGAGMAILTAIGLWKHFPVPVILVTAFLAVFHLLFAWILPVFLGPTRFLVTGIAHGVGWLLTNSVLLLFFYFLLTPFSFIVRLAGKEPIAKDGCKPCWKDFTVKENDPARIERLF